MGSGVSRYGALARHRGFAHRLPCAALGSLATAMLPLAVVTWIATDTRSYGQAGAVAAGLSLGYALLFPWRGRLVDRLDACRVFSRLGAAAAVAAALFVGLGQAGAPIAAIWSFAFAFGALQPPLGAALRGIVARAVDPELRPAAYSVQTALSELAFVLGPLLVVALTSLARPAAALGIAVLVLLLATAAYAVAERRYPITGTLPVPDSPNGHVHLLRVGPFVTLMASAAPFGVAIGALDVAAVAFADEHGHRSAAGAGLAALAAGIALGSLAFGSRRPRTDLVGGYAMSCIATTIALLILPLAGSLWCLTVILCVVGLCLGPLTAYEFLLLARVTPAHRATEGVAWLTSSGYVGVALGTSCAGVIVDGLGVQASLLLCGLSTTISAPIIWALRAKLTEDTSDHGTAKGAIATGHPSG